MKVQSLLAALLLLGSTSLAYAGGPPPVYVVVTKVEFDSEIHRPQWVKIWGSFTRYVPTVDASGNTTWAFSKPTYGYVFLSIPCKDDGKIEAELKEWKNSVGTGKAVAVGACGEAGALLKCPIHSPKETVAQPDAGYQGGHLKVFGTLYAEGATANYPAVKDLLQFAAERK